MSSAAIERSASSSSTRECLNVFCTEPLRKTGIIAHRAFKDSNVLFDSQNVISVPISGNTAGRIADLEALTQHSLLVFWSVRLANS